MLATGKACPELKVVCVMGCARVSDAALAQRSQGTSREGDGDTQDEELRSLQEEWDKVQEQLQWWRARWAAAQAPSEAAISRK